MTEAKRNEIDQHQPSVVDRVLVFPRGQMSELDKDRMLEHFGTLCVEADDPTAVVQLSMQAPLRLDQTILSADVITASLLRALAAEVPATAGGSITSTGRACYSFVKALANSLPKASA